MKTYRKIYQRYQPKCIPTRALMCVMMFTACWTSYVCRLQMPILGIPMTAPGNSSNHSGHCNDDNDKSSNVSRKARAIWYDPENAYELHWTYENEDQGYNSEDLSGQFDIGSSLNELRQKRDAELPIQARADEEGFSLFRKRSLGWNANIRSHLISSYGYGVLPGNFMGGIIAIKWGPRRSILWTSLIAAVLSLITPIIAQIHWGLLLVSRLIIGFTGGITFPACHTLVGKWAPPAERNRFVWSLLGGTFGTVFAYPMVSAIAETISWQFAWYIPSLLMLVWVAIWALMAYDSPAEHPGISDEEKEYILSSQAGVVNKEKPTLAQTPIKRIVTSLPFISLVLCHFGNMFLIYFYQNSMTQYLTKALGFKLAKGGWLSALPWLARMLFGFLFSWAGDMIKKRQCISVTWLRKLATIFSHFIPGLMMIGVSYVGCNYVLANVLLVLSLGFNGCAVIANLSNNQDLSPNFAGFLYGIMNTLGAVPAIIAPYIVTAFVGDEDSIENWQKVFWVAAAVCIVSMIIFFIGGSGKIQPWNEIPSSQDSAAPGTGGRPAPAAPAPTA